MKKFYLTCSLLVALAMTSTGFAVGPSYTSESTVQNIQDDSDGNFQYDDQARTGYYGRGYGSYSNDGYSYGDSSSCAPASAPACAPACAPTACAPEPACPPDRECGEYYCLMCKYEPCYYTTTRCEYDPCPQYKKCCRMVPKYYQKQCCRMVPQYYCQNCCKYEPEYYTTCCTVYRPRQVCDRHCKYVPKYYYQKRTGCAPAAAPTSCCPVR